SATSCWTRSSAREGRPPGWRPALRSVRSLGAGRRRPLAVIAPLHARPVVAAIAAIAADASAVIVRARGRLAAAVGAGAVADVGARPIDAEDGARHGAGAHPVAGVDVRAEPDA